MKWMLAILPLLPLTGSCSDTNHANIEWPKAIAEFPMTEGKPIRVDGYEISWEESKDQNGGGSGGPIISIKVSEIKSGWEITFTEQSAGERLLETYNGKP